MNPRYFISSLLKLSERRKSVATARGMASTPQSRHGIVALLACCVLIPWLAGCDGSGPPAKFSTSPRTEELMSPARKHVQKELTDHFGTPQDLVAWLRFPIQYGQVQGKIKSVESSEAGAYKFIVDWPDQKIEDINFRQGVGVLMTGGEYAGQSVKLNHFDSKTGQINIDVLMNPAPAVGDELTVIGHQLQSGRMVYMEHCVHCHGTSGDGNGPTAKYLNPRPRDYRPGIFKFTSTKQPEKVTTTDLKRIVKQGIPGTYMPSFMLLKDGELTAVVEYVRWLSIRGEMEKKMVDELYGDYSTTALRERKESGESEADVAKEFDELLKGDFAETVDGFATELSDAWSAAEVDDALIVPSLPRIEDSPESRDRGRKLFLSAKTKCVTCHGATGRGNGSATEDFWPIPGTQPPVNYAQRGLHDSWGNKLKPRDLTRGIYRGGRRPVDLYRRIYAGIKGTPMPAAGGTALKDDEIWDLVNYVLSIPFQTDRTIAEPLEVAPPEQATAATGQ
ncbi:MAG: c-type cytochrome [Planctomycetaceae bacterium]